MAFRVAVIGAGMAGLSCAQELRRAGFDVTVFDKGRHGGGRCATRRATGVVFDHGAQYVTAHSEAFQHYLDDATTQGAAGVWQAAGSGSAPFDLNTKPERYYVGVPGMNALVKPLFDGLTVHHSTRILTIRKSDAGWKLEPVDGVFDGVVLAVPAPQAVPLLGEHPFAAAVSRAVYSPCWAGMVAFETRVAGPDILRPQQGALVWAARNSSKPDREESPNDCWVLHASSGWSEENIDRDETVVAPEFYGMLTRAMGKPLPPPMKLMAHRWRYARVETALGQDCLWDGEQRLGVCGDFCLGARVEAAYTSGQALAQAIQS